MFIRQYEARKAGVVLEISKKDYDLCSVGLRGPPHSQATLCE